MHLIYSGITKVYEWILTNKYSRPNLVLGYLTWKVPDLRDMRNQTDSYRSPRDLQIVAPHPAAPPPTMPTDLLARGGAALSTCTRAHTHARTHTGGCHHGAPHTRAQTSTRPVLLRAHTSPSHTCKCFTPKNATRAYEQLFRGDARLVQAHLEQGCGVGHNCNTMQGEITKR